MHRNKTKQKSNRNTDIDVHTASYSSPHPLPLIQCLYCVKTDIDTSAVMNTDTNISVCECALSIWSEVALQASAGIRHTHFLLSHVFPQLTHTPAHTPTHTYTNTILLMLTDCTSYLVSPLYDRLEMTTLGSTCLVISMQIDAYIFGTKTVSECRYTCIIKQCFRVRVAGVCTHGCALTGVDLHKAPKMRVCSRA